MKNIFDRTTDLSYLNTLSFALDHFNELWEKRKATNNFEPMALQRELHDHIINMINEQLSRYPRFTLKMHLAPWTEQSAALYKLASTFIHERFTPGYICETQNCCSTVPLTARELQFCTENRSYPEIKKIIMTQLIKQPFERGHSRYYCSLTPFCELINQINTAELCLTPEDSLEHLRFLSTIDASTMLNCASGTVIWLADQGFLIKDHQNKIRGPGHKLLVQKHSVADFRKKYILVGEISASLGVAPREVVRITNKFEILPVHSFRGPYVFSRSEIEKAMDCLRNEVKSRYPHLALLDHISPRDIQQNKITTDEHSANRYCEICQGVHVKIKNLSRILNASPRLIQCRFFRSGLIKPHTTSSGTFCSRNDINYMIDHLQKYVSIVQAQRMVGCSTGKLNKFINALNIQPALKIQSPDFEIQYLYLREDIAKIKCINPH
ncbi:TPA: hypothetical protein NIH73_006706 [Pseudomonas aeruginosa]|nr:hypothetical protein [Pseudomonas aeruginosa]HCF6119511.1 hypothetical protein [Pseudomonas aeruginosa]